MKKLLPILIILIAGVLGGGGGYFLKQAGSSSISDEAPVSEAENDSHAKKEKKKEKASHGKTESADAAYMKFGRQFVVPIVRGGKPQMMMILDINIEIDESDKESIYSSEPKLRDALLAELIKLSSDGVLASIVESPEAMAEAKSALLERARAISGSGAKDILILDIGVQEY